MKKSRDYDEKYAAIKEIMSALDWLKFKEIRISFENMLHSSTRRKDTIFNNDTECRVLDEMMREYVLLRAKYHLEGI